MGTKLDSPEVLSFLVFDDVVYQEHPSYHHKVLLSLVNIVLILQHN